MKHLFILILLTTFQQTLLGQQQKIQSAKISFNFVAKDVEGHISGFSSTSTIDWDDPEKSIIKGSVSSETIKTGNFLRDWSLKGNTYFDADQFPKITFISTRVKVSEDKVLVDGELTIKGISKPIQINFEKKANQLVGSTTLFSSDFDITVLKKGRESNKVLVKFDLELE